MPHNLTTQIYFDRILYEISISVSDYFAPSPYTTIYMHSSVHLLAIES